MCMRENGQSIVLKGTMNGGQKWGIKVYEARIT
jgi:hypothetical protein